MRSRALVVAALLLGACSVGNAETSTTVLAGPGAETPVDAVEQLIGAMAEPDFVEASRFAVPGQAALASLAEGASTEEVAEALRSGDRDVAANFWSGFAQGANGVIGEAASLTPMERVTVEDTTFDLVAMVTTSGSDRTVALQDRDGYRVDLFASFASGLASKMVEPVERLLGNQTPDARFVLTELREVVPSLLLAAELADPGSETRQQVLSLVELITRVG